MFVVIVLCGVVGVVALAALAGARRTESAYGRYLQSVNASDALVNMPVPNLAIIPRVGALPGMRSSAALLGLNAYPVVRGRADDSFTTDDPSGARRPVRRGLGGRVVAGGHEGRPRPAPQRRAVLLGRDPPREGRRRHPLGSAVEGAAERSSGPI